MKVVLRILALLIVFAGLLLFSGLGALLTTFSSSQEFWLSAHATSAAVVLSVFGLYFARRARKWFPFGPALFFSLCASVILLVHVGVPEGYVARLDISIPNWYFDAFRYVTFGFVIVPVTFLVRNRAEPDARANDSACHDPC